METSSAAATLGERFERAVAALAATGVIESALLASRDGFPIAGRCTGVTNVEMFAAMHATALGAAEIAARRGREPGRELGRAHERPPVRLSRRHGLALRGRDRAARPGLSRRDGVDGRPRGPARSSITGKTIFLCFRKALSRSPRRRDAWPAASRSNLSKRRCAPDEAHRPLRRIRRRAREFRRAALPEPARALHGRRREGRRS